MNLSGKKTFLFIEPSLSSFSLILKAKEKGYAILVISAHSHHQDIPEPSSFFQLNTHNEAAVLDLVHKIADKFHIDGVIPGSEAYIPLTSKVAAYLNRPGLSPKAALKIRRKDLIRDILRANAVPIPPYWRVETKDDLKVALQKIGFPCILKPTEGKASLSIKKIHTLEEALDDFEIIMAHQKKQARPLLLVEKYIEGREYSVEGFLKNNSLQIISITEKICCPESNLLVKGYLVRPDIDFNLLIQIEPYLLRVISALKLNYGPFYAKIRLSKKGPLLIKITVCLLKDPIPKLIGYAMGIDYYDNTLKVFSKQPLSLHKTQHLHAGVIFFYDPPPPEINLNNPFIKEIKAYDNEMTSFSCEKKRIGHAILLHDDDESLKKQMVAVDPTINLTHPFYEGTFI